MIRNDFYTGGFPISKRVPIICVLEQNITVCYNNYDLKLILDLYRSQKLIDKVACFGVWPGKMNTDLFLIDHNYYGFVSPPEIHKDIDSALLIEVFLSGGEFEELVYISPLPLSESIRVTDPAVYDYVKKIGMRFKTTLR